MSVSLAVFGLGTSLAVPATPVTDDAAGSVDYRCGIISIEENAGHPLSSDLLEDLLVASSGQQMRVATFDVGLSGENPGELAANLAGGQEARAVQVATAIQRSGADVVLLTGIDADESAVRTFNDEYLKQAQADGRASDYPYRYVGPTNKGVPSGADLDEDKIIGGPADAWGYGQFPGQGSMVLLSKHPIDRDNIQTITDQRWAELPGSRISEAGLGATVAEAMPLMESGLWDIPLTVAGQQIRVIAVQANQDPEETRYAAPRHSDQLTAIGDWLAAEPYIRDDADAAPARSVAYVVLGELGRGVEHNAEVDALLEKIGVAEQGVHDQSNYILADSDLEITRHGRIATPSVDGAVPESDGTVSGAAADLLWSDLKF